MLTRSFYLPALLIFLFACGQETTENTKKEAANNPGKPARLAETDAITLIRQWNRAHHPDSTAAFLSLYDAEVIYYKTTFPKEKCLEKKRSFFAKHPDYEQEIIGRIQLDTLAAGELKGSFVKEVRFNGETKRYAAYLHLKKRESGWKISTEGDETTDLNLQKKKMAALPADASKIAGDFNGDGKQEYMWLERPAFPSGDMEENFGECQGECNCMLRFSDASIPAIELSMCIGGLPENKGDLNGDGTDEIGILPDWWTSCWRSYFVYTLKAQNWEHLVAPITTHCTQWDDGFGFIQKHPSKKGYVLIEYSIWEEEDIHVRKKAIKITG